MDDLKLKELVEKYQSGRYTRDDVFVFGAQQKFDESVLKEAMDKVDADRLLQEKEDLSRQRDPAAAQREDRLRQKISTYNEQTYEDLHKGELLEEDADGGQGFAGQAGGDAGTSLSGTMTDSLNDFVPEHVLDEQRKRREEKRKAIRENKYDPETAIIKNDKNLDKEADSRLDEALEYEPQKFEPQSAYEKKRAERNEERRKRRQAQDDADFENDSGRTHPVNRHQAWTLDNQEDEFLNNLMGTGSDKKAKPPARLNADKDREAKFEETDWSDLEDVAGKNGEVPNIEPKKKKVKESTDLRGAVYTPQRSTPNWDIDDDIEDDFGDVEPDEDDLDYLARTGPGWNKREEQVAKQVAMLNKAGLRITESEILQAAEIGDDDMLDKDILIGDTGAGEEDPIDWKGTGLADDELDEDGNIIDDNDEDDLDDDEDWDDEDYDDDDDFIIDDDDEFDDYDDDDDDFMDDHFDDDFDDEAA